MEPKTLGLIMNGICCGLFSILTIVIAISGYPTIYVALLPLALTGINVALIVLYATMQPQSSQGRKVAISVLSIIALALSVLILIALVAVGAAPLFPYFEINAIFLGVGGFFIIPVILLSINIKAAVSISKFSIAAHNVVYVPGQDGNVQPMMVTSDPSQIVYVTAQDGTQQAMIIHGRL